MQLSKNRTYLVFIILVFILILFFFARSFLFNYAVKKLVSKLESHKLHAQFENAELKGLRSALFEKFCIKNDQQDTVFYSDSIYLKLKISRFLLGKFELSELSIKNTKVEINALYFKNALVENKDSVRVKAGYDKRLKKLFDIFFDYIPIKLEIKNFQFEYKSQQSWFAIEIPEIGILNKTILVSDSCS